jgi:hypothetical protein
VTSPGMCVCHTQKSDPPWRQPPSLVLASSSCPQLCYCLKTWQELPASVRNGGRPTKEEALLAVAVVNRIRRAISQVGHSGASSV